MTYAYLYPGSELLRTGSVTRVMSDDSDPASLPHAYGSLIRAFDRDWTALLYGAVAIDQGHPRHDSVTWISWVERWVVVAVAPFVPLEQISTAVVFVLLLLTALSFRALARAWGCGEPVALALGAAWAFCPFERARAKVHMGMVGTYHLPLIFLGLHLVARGRDRRSLGWAALCFWAACTTLQYLIITAAALTPLYLVYLYLAGGRRPFVKVLGRAAVAALPAVLFLGWSLKFPVPADANVAADQVFPTSGDVVGAGVHPFLTWYAARPLDYLGSDIALTWPAGEWLWPRAKINARTLADLGPAGNTHERTNGIRWLLILIAGLTVWRARGRARRAAWFFVAFGAACFWLSLGPDSPVPGFGLSGWLWRVVHAVRVPSRAGIGVHFAVLALVARGLRGPGRTRGRRLLAAMLPALVILEYPPFATPMPFAPVRPPYEHLNHAGQCATGLLFPYVDDQVFMIIYYHFKQRLRGTGCDFVNALTEPAALANLRGRFPTSVDYVNALERNPSAEDEIVKLARCVPLGWIAFDEVTPAATRARTCAKLGWQLNANLTCVDPGPVVPMQRTPDVCP